MSANERVEGKAVKRLMIIAKVGGGSELVRAKGDFLFVFVNRSE